MQDVSVHAQRRVSQSRPVALVTGAARRIGRSIAIDLAQHGWDVAVHYHHSVEDAQTVLDEITGLGGRAVGVRADLSSEEQTVSLISEAASELGPVVCLINNASVFEDDRVLATTRESWDRHLNVNLRAPLVLTEAFARQLPQSACGNVINLLDQRVWRPTPYFLSYTVSKVGLWSLTQTLAMALAPSIRVNAIGPGPTLASVHQTAEQFARQCARTPLARQVQLTEICSAVRFLLDAPSITGQMIAIDAGQHLGWMGAGSVSPVDEK